MTTLWPPRTPSLRAPPGDLTQARPPSSLPGRPEEPWSDRFHSLPPASARFAFRQDTLGLLLPPGKCESFPCRGPSWHKPGPTPALRPTASSLPGGGHELTHLTEDFIFCTLGDTREATPTADLGRPVWLPAGSQPPGGPKAAPSTPGCH